MAKKKAPTRRRGSLAKRTKRTTKPKAESQVAASHRPQSLHVLSDSTGNLAYHMLTAFLTQFPPGSFHLRRHNFLDTAAKVDAAMEHVAADPGIVFHAVVSRAAKERIGERCEALGRPHCDLTGQFVQFLAEQSGVEPKADVQRLHDISSEYKQRIKALEYTLEHDDGLGLETIDEADIVLVGVSRTSKTPTSIYLAQQGYRVANVSLAQQVQPPRELLAARGPVIVGLVIQPSTLAEIRTNRQRGWRMTDTSYNDPQQVSHEVAWSRKLFQQQGWPILDVTDQAVEETAAKITDILAQRRR